MSYQCELINHPAQNVLSIRTHAAVPDLPTVLPQLFGAVAQYMGQLGQPITGAPLVAYYNMDMQNMDIEVGYPVAQKLPGQGNIQFSQMAGGKAAACLYIGPYDQIQRAYETLTQWMQAHSYEGTGVCYEVYLNDPAQNPPEALQTQIMFLIK